MTLSAAQRARVEEYVRPLYTELDGVETFGRVGEIEQLLIELAEGVDHEPDLLELLTLFHGVVGRLGSLARGSRWHLFMRSLGIAAERIARLRRGLEGFVRRPQTAEDRLLHDAVLLERSGVGAVISRLLAAGRKRLALDRALTQLDAGPEPERFHTRRGQEIAAQRHEVTMRWIAELRSLIAAENGSTSQLN
ncbi:MAG: hypothetical protein O7A98_02000 [Acidobacteria bacterium]|nr:hypothetical protein [Acidobacteriota bacterium]